MLIVLQSTVDAAIAKFVTDVLSTLPRLFAAGTFVILAGGAVFITTRLLRRLLERTMPGESPVYRQFVITIVAMILWFGVLLSTLAIVGLSGIATAFGTATGFLALGVAYALSGMIADAVAGVYLLRDPDFQQGDVVVVESITGEIRSIELRKTRLGVDGDIVVMANGAIESEWRKVGQAE